MNALDGGNCLNYTLWTYVPDNSHQWGDLWNGEDLSLWSKDDAKKTESWIDNGKGSTASLSTANSKSLAQSTSSTLVSGATYDPKGIESGDGVTAGLILEGSRAVGAVVRPYAKATVGTPLRIDFDIASSTFKFSVKVTPQDKVPEDVTTEIYLPFVHYALSLEPYHYSDSYTNSRTSLVSSRSSTPTPSEPTKGSSPLKLGVVVDTTHGSHTIVGQTLYWKYPVPAQGEATYTIEVKRIGGAIKRDLGYVQAGGWGDVCPNCTIA